MKNKNNEQTQIEGTEEFVQEEKSELEILKEENQKLKDDLKVAQYNVKVYEIQINELRKMLADDALNKSILLDTIRKLKGE